MSCLAKNPAQAALISAAENTVVARVAVMPPDFCASSDASASADSALDSGSNG